MPDFVNRRQPRRGEIWLVALGAARKGEIGKTRPALVISVDGLLTGSPYDLITIVPLTTSSRQKLGFLLPSVQAGNGLQYDSVILTTAPRAIVMSRFLRYLGDAPDDVFDQVIEARAYVEGWDD